MYASMPGILDGYGTTRPLLVQAPSYTNETNVAQSRPLESIGVLAPGGGLVGTRQQWTPQRTVAPTPTNPAAPNPMPSTVATDAQKKANPVVWIGVAAGILVILWAMR